jgi:GDP-L-fucose synthase
MRTHAELDLRDERAVEHFFDTEKPEYVFLAAAKAGGILANRDFPADFLRDNLAIQTHVISHAHRAHVKKLAFLGSSCIYPREAPQPIREDSLLTGPLEETNRAYALAKIAGVEMCQSYARQYGANFISLMPTNLYGPNDNFNLETAHVIPALIRKFYEAKQNASESVMVWGTGSPRREFLHADDLGRASVFLMEKYDSPEIINVGTGEDVSIKELAELLKTTTGFEGEIEWDSSKPDGAPRKLLDVSRIRSLGWRHSIELREGIRSAYDWYLQNQSKN